VIRIAVAEAAFGAVADALPRAQRAASEKRVTAAEARADRKTATADRAIAEFSALAERLAALVEERARPWWGGL
jgi:hypothetical protein